jgi:flagellar biosynthesis protein FlhA
MMTCRVLNLLAASLLAGAMSGAHAQAVRTAPSVLAVPSVPGGAQQAADYIVAVVNSEPITNQQVRQESQRLARQLSDAARGPEGYVPMITLSADWEVAFTESLIGPADDRQLAMAPSKLSDFMQKLRDVFDKANAMGEQPVLVCSGAIRAHVRAIVERFRPSTPVLSHTEIHPRARIRTVGSL